MPQPDPCSWAGNDSWGAQAPSPAVSGAPATDTLFASSHHLVGLLHRNVAGEAPATTREGARAPHFRLHRSGSGAPLRRRRPIGPSPRTAVPPLRHYSSMNLPISAEIHHDGDWYVAFCPEVPEANGQGRTEEECLESLRQAILLLMEDRREDAKSRLKDEATLLELA